MDPLVELKGLCNNFELPLSLNLIFLLSIFPYMSFSFAKYLVPDQKNASTYIFGVKSYTGECVIKIID